MHSLTIQRTFYEPPPDLARDRFDRADGALSGMLDETGKTWTAHSDYTVTSNQLDGGQTSNVTAWLPVGSSQVKVSAKLVAYNTAGNVRRPGLIARHTDDSNYILALMSPDTSEVLIYKNVAGSFTSLGTYTATITQGTEYPIALVTTINNVLMVYFQKVLILSVTDSAGSTNTNAGIRQGVALLPVVATEMADDFLVTRLR